MIDVLLSYAFHSTIDLRGVRSKMPEGSLLMLDSGAYTAWTKGRQVSLDAYAEWLRKNEGGWDYAITLDSIGDWRASARNTRALHDQGLPVLPVYHYGSPYAEFLSMCRDTGMVCAGGMKPLARSRSGMAAYLRRLVLDAEERGAVVHALGVGSTPVIRSSGVASADSSTVSRGPLNGTVTTWQRGRLVAVQATDAAGLRSAADGMRRYGLPTATMMRQGRLTKEVRVDAFAAGLLAASEMWMAERRNHPVPGPPGHPGPRYFNSMTTTEGVAAVLLASRIGGRLWVQ